jgi:hypothetical protein
MERRHGYDGTSNMKGNAKGLKKIIVVESPCAYYVDFFAHQFQITLVIVAEENGVISFCYFNNMDIC